MSDRFKIRKSRNAGDPRWFMDYPHGFTEPDGPIGEICPSFEAAIAAFINAANEQCPQCLRGAVVDTDWGWRCENCGSYDIAVGKIKRTAPC